MKFFSKTRRTVPAVRKKYGTPENKKDALERLRKEKESKEKIASMKKEILEKNKDEFHFSFYSVNKNMVKKTSMSEDQLKKMLRYVESEIQRCKRIIETRLRPGVGIHVIFSGKEKDNIKHKDDTPKNNEYEEYVLELIKKKKEIVEKLDIKIKEASNSKGA